MNWSEYAAFLGLPPQSEELEAITSFLHDVGTLVWFKDVRLQPPALGS